MRSRRFPPHLAPGARVGFIAPSGPLRESTELEQAMQNARALGWEPVLGRYVLDRDGYLAGSDEHRVADLNQFAADDTIDAIWCLRGGYGAMRLLDRIDYDAWRRRPRALIGYSDITALHSAIGPRADLVTFHGPTARAELTLPTRESFAGAMTNVYDETVIASGGMTPLHAGRARGRLIGGNLALVAALLGTPYAWEFDEAILVLEDVSESVYRTDRMLTQLRLSGALTRIAGLAFGSFTDIPDEPTNADRGIDRVLREFGERVGVPCVMDFPIGHVPDHVTLPLGAIAELDADAGSLTILGRP
jgi:muramoyltetrapeptide carboxypeptidase